MRKYQLKGNKKLKPQNHETVLKIYTTFGHFA
jgi:hypothetical protein